MPSRAEAAGGRAKRSKNARLKRHRKDGRTHSMKVTSVVVGSMSAPDKASPQENRQGTFNSKPGCSSRRSWSLYFGQLREGGGRRWGAWGRTRAPEIRRKIERLETRNRQEVCCPGICAARYAVLQGSSRARGGFESRLSSSVRASARVGKYGKREGLGAVSSKYFWSRCVGSQYMQGRKRQQRRSRVWSWLSRTTGQREGEREMKGVLRIGQSRFGAPG